jgi:hypothetical protein
MRTQTTSSRFAMPALLPSNATRSEHHDPDLETAEKYRAALASGTGGAGASAESALLERDALRSDRYSDPAAPNIAMRPVTGAFDDALHEALFAAQHFRLAYPGHVLLMALTLSVTVLIVLVASTPDLKLTWGIGALCAALGLAGAPPLPCPRPPVGCVHARPRLPSRLPLRPGQG